jgi:hypothetical protein
MECADNNPRTPLQKELRCRKAEAAGTASHNDGPIS